MAALGLELTWERVGVGQALQRQGRMEEAEAALRVALSIAPDSAVATFNMASLCEAQGRVEEAVWR